MGIEARSNGRFTAKVKLPNGSTLNVGTYHSRETAAAACAAEYERIRNGEFGHSHVTRTPLFQPQ